MLHPAVELLPTSETPPVGEDTVAPPESGGVRVARALIDMALEDASERAWVTIRYVDHEEERQADRDLLPQELEPFHAALEGVVMALALWPDTLQSACLDEVYLHDTLWNGEYGRGGFAQCQDRSIHLALENTSRRWFVDAIHHEMAHLAMLCGPGFDHDGWGRLSVDHRPESVGEVIERGIAREQSRDLVRDGFLTRYAATNPREDFAELVELAFGDPRLMQVPDTLRGQSSPHSKLAAKIEFLDDQWRAWTGRPFPRAPADDLATALE